MAGGCLTQPPGEGEVWVDTGGDGPPGRTGDLSRWACERTGTARSGGSPGWTGGGEEEGGGRRRSQVISSHSSGPSFSVCSQVVKGVSSNGRLLLQRSLLLSTRLCGDLDPNAAGSASLQHKNNSALIVRKKNSRLGRVCRVQFI